MKMPLKSLQALSLTTLIGLHVACTPLAEVKNFGETTKNVSTVTATCYSNFNTSLVDARRNTAILNKEPLTPDVLKSPLADSFRLRVQMLNALGGYAATLETLATKDTNAEINKSSTSFASNLNSLSNTYKKSTSRSLGLSSSDISVLATTLKVAGNGYTEYKRKQAIRKIVKAVDPSIQKVCAYLPGELRKTGNTLDGFLQAEVNAHTRALNSNLSTLPSAQAIEQGKKLQELSRRQQETLPLFNAAASAIEKVGKTHAKLVVAVDTKEFTTSELYSSLSELEDYTKEVLEFYETTKPTAVVPQ
jgi:hypothetical protein